MPNIDDVAKVANVSIATVSRVFNNSPFVSEKAKERVLKAAKELGYEPSILARSLAKKKTNIIGLIVPDISNPYYGEIVKGIENVCNENRYDIILCSADNSKEKELQYIDMLKSRWVDGIIFHSDYFTEEQYKVFEKKKIPVVLAGRATDFDVPYAVIDNFQAAYDATKYLISIGHKKIGFIHGSLDGMRRTIDSVDRFLGYKKAMEDGGLRIYDELIQESNFKAKGGYEATLKMLKCGVMPDAIFAISDVMAMGAINAIFDFGLKCPDDISVMGFDNIDISEVTRPALTTIAQPMHDIGAVAAQMLIKMINNEVIEKRRIVLKHKLIIRDSCRVLD